MTAKERILTEEEEADLAFDLLTSSSIERYQRKVAACAGVRRLRHALDVNPALARSYLEAADTFWFELRRAGMRSEVEVRLAALLLILADGGFPKVDALLLQCSLDSASHTAWISGMARRLLRSRRSTELQGLGAAQSQTVVYKASSIHSHPWAPLTVYQYPKQEFVTECGSSHQDSNILAA